MDNKRINILLVEDEGNVADLIKEMLKKSNRGDFNIEGVSTLKEAMGKLEENKFDAVLLDLNLPDSKGLETLDKMRSIVCNIAIVVLTGLDDAGTALEAVKKGAQDYLMKSEVSFPLLVRSLQYAIERNRIEEALRESCETLEEKVKERTRQLSESNRLLTKEIEERKKKEQELRVAYTKLKETQSQLIQAEKMRMVGMLASGVAHEVKNPLAIILQGIEFLEKRVDSYDDNIKLTFNVIKEAINRADSIVKGLLDFSSISQLEVSKVDINSLLEESIFLLKHQFDKRQIKVTKEFSDNLPSLYIDKNRIEQVFVNIFMNAAYAMEKGGVLKVRTRLSDDHLRLIVEVEDTGCGIDENIIDKIFDPFFTTNRGKGGTGLGLAIVKNIVEMHGGEIEVSNKEEGGVRVIVVFKIGGR